METNWKLTARTVVISTLLGFGGGVLATALTTDYLSDYAASLGELSEPPRLEAERPRTAPQTYVEAVREVTESVLPGVARLHYPGAATAFASGAVLTSDGWIVTTLEHLPSFAGATVTVEGKSYAVEQAVPDAGTGAVFVKVGASNLPVLAFGKGFDLAPGDQLFIPPSSTSLFVETVVESRWPAGALSSDVPQRRILVENPLLGEYNGAPAVNVRGELIGLIESGGAGFTHILPIDGLLTVFNSLLREGKAVRPSLGVNFTVTTKGTELVGASSVKKGSAAAAAGLLPGDIVIAVDGMAVGTGRSLDEFVVTRAPGDLITLRLLRGETEQEIKVTLGNL
jgi:S1-C subfamily serine protease